MGRGLGKIARVGGTAAGVLAGAVVVALNRTADATDALANQSRRLQFPIEDLQEWKFVAEQSGVSQELLDKSLGAFTKRLGEAKAGTGPLVTGLKKINPALLKQLNQTTSVSEAFELYIRAMRTSKSATEKAALANAAFSRAGLELVNISDNSAAAIKALRTEQRENGLVTQEQAENAEAYNDAMNSLKKSIGGLIQGVLLPLTPAITKTLRSWRDWIVANRELIQTKITDFLIKAWTQVKKLAAAAVDFSSRYDLTEMLGATVGVLVSLAGFLSENAGWLFKAIGVFLILSGVLKVFIAIMTAVNLVMALNPIGLIVLGVVAAVAAIAALVYWFDDVKAALLDLGMFLLENNPFTLLLNGLNTVLKAVTGFDLKKMIGDQISEMAEVLPDWLKVRLGIDGAEADQTAAAPQMVSPQDRTARQIEETRSTSTAEVTLKADRGTSAAVTKGKLGPGLNMAMSGAF